MFIQELAFILLPCLLALKNPLGMEKVFPMRCWIPSLCVRSQGLIYFFFHTEKLIMKACRVLPSHRFWLFISTFFFFWFTLTSPFASWQTVLMSNQPNLWVFFFWFFFFYCCKPIIQILTTEFSSPGDNKCLLWEGRSYAQPGTENGSSIIKKFITGAHVSEWYLLLCCFYTCL